MLTFQVVSQLETRGERCINNEPLNVDYLSSEQLT